jgi:hypothetical protein
METAELPPARLVNASFSLFLCAPTTFPELWRRIHRTLLPGGRLACQLLGPEDDWAGRSGLSVHDPPSLCGLLSGYAVEHLERERTEAITPRGHAKRWDLWHLVLRRG